MHAEEPAQLLTFRAELGALGGTERVIEEAWDLPELRAGYEQFVEDFVRLRPRGGEASFAAQTALVHAWRRFPFVDPDLPDDLLPRDWPRRRAYELFRDRHEKWAPAAQEHFDGLAS